MNQSRFMDHQNRKLSQLLLDLNHDLKTRENPVVQVGMLQMFGYTVIGLIFFLILSGILRACVNAHH